MEAESSRLAVAARMIDEKRRDVRYRATVLEAETGVLAVLAIALLSGACVAGAKLPYFRRLIAGGVCAAVLVYALGRLSVVHLRR